MVKNVLITIPAHFDGEQIRLDVEVALKPRTPLLVTVLGEEPSDQFLLREVMKSSETAFARVWENDEDAAYDTL